MPKGRLSDDSVGHFHTAATVCRQAVKACVAR